jgi:hypothetical protein
LDLDLDCVKKNDKIDALDSCTEALNRLKNATRDDLIVFLEFILDHSNIRVQSSIRQYFKHWRQLFRRHAQALWSSSWTVEVNDV